MAYVDLNDIDDAKIRQLLNTGAPEYLLRASPYADKALEMLAHRRGVHYPADISVDVDGYVTNHDVKMWWIYTFCQYVFENGIGTNSTQMMDADIYVYKAEMYSKKLMNQSKKITRYTLIDEIERIGQVSTGSVQIQRG